MNTEDKKSMDTEEIDTISTQVAVGFAALKSAKTENVRIDLVKHKATERKWIASAGLTGHPFSEADGETPLTALLALRKKTLDELGSTAKRLSQAIESATK